MTGEYYYYKNPSPKLYATISETETATSENAFIEISNDQYGNYYTEIEGGREYYLHLRFYRERYASEGKTEIRRIELKKEEEIGEISTTIEGGKIETKGENSRGIYNTIGKVTMKEGEIVGINTGIYNNSSYDVEMIGGTVKASKGTGIMNYSTGKVEMTGGNVLESNYGIYNVSTGEVKIIDGNIKCKDYGIYNQSTGLITVEKGHIEETEYYYKNEYSAIYNEKAGEIKILGGTVQGEGHGIYNQSTGTIEISNTMYQQE